MTLGRVSRPNGLSGAVVVQIDPSMTGVLVRDLDVELAPKSGAPFRSRVRSAAPIRGGLRITFEGVRDRNASEALVGAEVIVDRDALGFEEGEFLESDLVGLAVVDGEGVPLGQIEEVIATGANDVYVARAADGAEILIPAVGHAVLDVDLESRQMTVDPSALEFGGAPAAEHDSSAAGENAAPDLSARRANDPGDEETR